jgi:MOSC domain-containing protein YiiM
MKVISLNIGKAKTVKWKNATTKTAFWKTPVNEALQVSALTIVGDEQADPRFHGGENKALYAYDISHYEHWKKVLLRDDWQHGMFGENLSTEGLLDNEVKIGNIYQIGTAKLQVTQPRFPCMKLNMRFNDPFMVKLFTQQKRNGIYFKVVEEGTIQAGDTIKLIETSVYNISIADVVECYNNRGQNQQRVKEILAISYLPKMLKKDFEEFIETPKLF